MFLSGFTAIQLSLKLVRSSKVAVPISTFARTRLANPVMQIAAFLPPRAAESVQKSVAPSELFLARNWIDLDSRLRKPGIGVLVVDPSAEGAMNLRAAATILRRHRSIPSVAYLELRPENLKAVLQLSKYGLEEVLLRATCEDNDCLIDTLRRLSGKARALEILGVFGPSLAGVAPGLLAAIQDLVEHPVEYQNAADIAHAGGLSRKQVYRAFQRAHLGTPRKFLNLVRVLWGYGCLCETHLSVPIVSAALGYRRPHLFSDYFSEILGSPPSRPQIEIDKHAILMSVIEWLRKPATRARRFLKSA
jgi:AraC-like DNA-binding protein